MTAIRALPLGLGVAAIAGAYLLPWRAWLGFFPEHMVQHMTLVAIAAPLLVLGAAPRGRAPGIMLAAVLEAVVVWGWHLPAAHGLACLGGPWKLLEQATFLGAGLLVWWSALSAEEPLTGALGLLLTSMHMTLLGALLTLAPQPLYSETCALCGALDGQRLGGLLMLGIGTPIYLLCGLWLTVRALGPDPAEGAA
ncbi:putative membrane protein [Roseivivax marinus]|uniref:cytochrome c oxidase assembly protein n=1 Tax=Roseivivax marinus TaxID=1379903 RepID=UPI0008B96EC6|nr:cytochrome c oxidase assembly protein [Roseivivax marinus]SEK71847.1 putative membrane protein [Roseivivax marinus]